jgi:glutaredoxin-related protein
MKDRYILPTEKISELAQVSISKFHGDIVLNVKNTVEREKVVVFGMKQNPVVKQARSLLESHNVAYSYLEYGSYFSKWKERLAIKLWSGWPTFPQIFVKGILIGGYSDLKVELSNGDLQKRLLN